MKKILCPNCKKVLSFEACGAIVCPSCKKTIFVEELESDRKIFGGMSSQEREGAQISYCGDEIFASRVMQEKADEKTNLQEACSAQFVNIEIVKYEEPTEKETSEASAKNATNEVLTERDRRNEVSSDIETCVASAESVRRREVSSNKTGVASVENGRCDEVSADIGTGVASAESDRHDEARNIDEYVECELDIECESELLFCEQLNNDKNQKSNIKNAKKNTSEARNRGNANQSTNKNKIADRTSGKPSQRDKQQKQDYQKGEENSVAKRKLKKLKLKRTIKLSMPIATTVALVFAVLIGLIAPVGKVVIAGEKVAVSGAKYIGLLLTQTQLNNTAATIMASCLGGFILCAIVCTIVYALYSFKIFGGYSKKAVATANFITLFLGAIGVLVLSLCVALNMLSNDGVFHGREVVGGLIASILFVCVMIANGVSRICYTSAKHVVLSPKKTQFKAYIILGISIFFVSTLILSVLATQGGNIARNILSKILPESSPILSNLSIYSAGITKKALSFMFFSDPNFVSETANQTYFTYTTIATGLCLFALVIIYIFYINRSKEIFLGKVRNNDSANKFKEDDFEQKTLSKFLKKNTWLTFAIFALVLTSELASNIFLYLGSEQIVPAVFSMLSGVAVLAVQCCPYAMFAREQYMQAFYEFDDMGAEVTPIEKKQLKAVTIIPILIAFAINILYAVFVFVL